MNELTVCLSENELMMIGSELKRLFLFQDRPFASEKQAAFLEEIQRWGIPAGAIMSGIRKLMSEELKSLKLATIKDAAGEFIYRDEIEKQKCQYCEKRGIVLMTDEEHYEYAFACSCGNGNRYRSNNGLATWNGEGIQIRHGKTLNLRFGEFLFKN